MSPRLRYAVAGVGGLALAVVVGLVIAAVLRGVTAPSEAPVAAPTTSPTTTAPVEAPAPAPAPPVVERPEPGTNECVDALGDAALDLDSAKLALADGALAVQFRLATPPPDGEVALGVTVQRGGDKTYLLGVSLRDGDIEEVFVQDFDRDDKDDVDPRAAKVDGSTVTVIFPRDAIKRLGNDWSWSAFASAGDGDTDSCPEPPDLLRLSR